MSIEQHLIFWPVLAQIALTLVMYFILAGRKSKAIKAGKEDRQKAALDNKAWDVEVVKVSNNIDNQYEAPVLFYVLCIALYTLQGVTLLTLTFAWVFAVSRYIHAYIHTGSNYVPHRLGVFTLGVVMLLLMLAMTIWHLGHSTFLS